jgi:hypothetical protein
LTVPLRARRGCGPALFLLAVSAPAQEPERSGWLRTLYEDDYALLLFAGGVEWRFGGTQLRAEQGVLTFDADEYRQALGAAGEQGPPRRGAQPPPARRLLDENELRARLYSFLRAAGAPARRSPASTVETERAALRMFRSVYLEGNVAIERDGQILARARSVYFSATDDRAVFEDLELRLRSVDKQGRTRTIVVRGPRLLRQGPRISGRDVSVTTCTAGEPHFDVRSGEVEILERGDEFEVRMRDNTFAIGGKGLLPLPDVRWFTGDQNDIPVQGASAGYSSKEGVKVQLDLGASWNRAGGALHEFLTGRPAHEFRGDWHLGLGWIEERGFPLDAGLTYGADGVYRGRTEFFHLDDHGENLREIQTYLDGSPIDNDRRALWQSENRVWLGQRTTLDLTLFDASDPAVWSEFYKREYREHELPESSLHLRHAQDHWITTLTGRHDRNGFSYDDRGQLATSFREELPYGTFDVFSQPLADLPGDVPLLLGSATGIGQLRRSFDDRLGAPVSPYETTRLSEVLDLSAPFRLGPIGLRPYVSATFVHYESDLVTGDENRYGFEAGIAGGLRLARSWRWSEDGHERALRHVISPVVEFKSRFGTSADPASYPQFDDLDSFDDQTAIRVVLLNRLQRMVAQGGALQADDVLWLDLAQTFYPLGERDNQGHLLGLTELELLLRPGSLLLLPDPRVLVEGEYDWTGDELRTFNTGLRTGPLLGIDWFAEYRTDATVDGAVGYGIGTSLFGRWGFDAYGQYDLDRSEQLNYAFRLTRNEHDWRILLEVSFDVISDETTLSLNFEPTLGGLFRPRDRGYVGGNRLSSTPGW